MSNNVMRYIDDLGGEFRELEVHPTLALFLLMSDEALDGLAADIDLNGQINAIILAPDNITIVDGRNRWLACRRTKTRVDPVFRTLGKHDRGELLVDYVLAQNLRRRELNPGQRSAIEVAARQHLAEAKETKLREDLL